MAGVIQAILMGIGFGMLIAILVGPVFFMLLQTSIEKGFLVGLLFAIGVIISDSMFFFTAYICFTQISDNKDFTLIMGSVGGAILLVVGILLLRRKPKITKAEAIDNKGSLLLSLLKGFGINSLNPSGVMSWLAIVGAVRPKFESHPKLIFVLFLSCMLTIFSTDVLKSFLAFRLKHAVTPKFMLWLNRFSGGALMVAASKLLFDALREYLHRHNF